MTSLKLQKSGKKTITSADWYLDPEELSEKFNSKTKAIIINTPNNPVGKVSTHLSHHLLAFQPAPPLRRHSIITFSWLGEKGPPRYYRPAQLMWQTDGLLLRFFLQVFTRDELQMIAELCIKHDTLCFSDEVYEWLVYKGQQHVKIGGYPVWAFVMLHTLSNSGNADSARTLLFFFYRFCHILLFAKYFCILSAILFIYKSKCSAGLVIMCSYFEFL